MKYSDVVKLQGPQEAEKVSMANNNADSVSVLSDLYASVQIDRTKTLDTVDGNDGYANHVWETKCWWHAFQSVIDFFCVFGWQDLEMMTLVV